MLTRFRNNLRPVSFLAMWLITMATVLVTPGACASGHACSTVAPVAVVQSAIAKVDAPSCPMMESAGTRHCNMGGACCESAPVSSTASKSLAPPATARHAEACIAPMAQPTDTALTSLDSPTHDLMAAFPAAEMPWIFLATQTAPFTPAPTLPPRDASARPQGSRAPPAFLA
jgi:hypothetical protein